MLHPPSAVASSFSTRALSAAAAASAAVVVATATATATTWYPTTSTTGCQEQQQQQPEDDFRIEVHLMDKIQQKHYLQSASKDAAGIPSKLRILAVDLPELRTDAFSGVCRLSHDKIFLDEVAPPKVIAMAVQDKDEGHPNNSKEQKKKQQQQQQKLKVAQKTLVKSLIQCQSPQSQQKVGVEILEASVADLNPHKLRKTHQFGNIEYDPGKYYDETKKQQLGKVQSDTVNDHQQVDQQVDVDVDQDQVAMPSHQDELQAPWNQYAWIEELRLRISGQVPFAAPMEKSPRLAHYMFGNVYKVSVPSARRFWEWPLPNFMKSDPDGIDDGGKNKKTPDCRACHKPHAVIANGAALQRVPSSLRLLQKFCRESDVPLFVIYDPRVWGGNTHQNLPQALKELRSTVKNRVIGQALKQQQQGSSSFSRGRMLGQIETEAKWRTKDQTRRARNVLTGQGGNNRRRKTEEQPRDWTQLDDVVLEKKLVERGVIKKIKEGDGPGSSSSGSRREYTKALINIARQCVADEQARQVNGDNTESSSSPAPSPESPAPSKAQTVSN